MPVQEVAFAELHDKVDDWPPVMEEGLADRFAVGAPAALTVTVAEADAVSVPSVQVIEYVCEDVRVTITEPEVAPPVEKLVPVQEVVYWEFQKIHEEPPEDTEEGTTMILAVGVVTGTPGHSSPGSAVAATGYVVSTVKLLP